MFKLEHHQKIHTVLEALNSDFFKSIGAYFGGGTQLALQYGEYRWSKDIDFICPVGAGYKALRDALSERSYSVLFSHTEALKFPRDIRADQYGVRFPVEIDHTITKFEIVAEGRISLGKPTFLEWCSVPCLNFDDDCTEKLLANTDHWNDASIEARDLIDLAILRLQGRISTSAFDKANSAYDVEGSLRKSLEYFQSNSDLRTRYFNALNLKSPPLIIDGIDLLAADYSMPSTQRLNNEQD